MTSSFGSAIADGSITGFEVQDNSLSGADISDGSVTGADVQDNSLTGSDINEGALGEVPTAKIGGFGRYAEGGTCNPSSNAYLDCKITTINLPYQAKVLLIGHVNAYPNSGDDVGGFCKLVTNDGDVAGAYTYFAVPGNDFGDVGAIVGITGVLGVGSHDFAVDCNQYTGDIAYSYVGITAVAISPD